MTNYYKIAPANDKLKGILSRKIMILDGAMGTMIQALGLSEGDYRGEQFKDWKSDLKENNDLLNLTRPDAIKKFISNILRQARILLRQIHLIQIQSRFPTMGWKTLLIHCARLGLKLQRTQLGSLC
jgi:hypothetical protein